MHGKDEVAQLLGSLKTMQASLVQVVSRLVQRSVPERAGQARRRRRGEQKALAQRSPRALRRGREDG